MQTDRNRETLFEVMPVGNVYDRPIVLYQDTWQVHIQPFKANVTVDAIRAVSQTPSYIYQDKTENQRHVLLNNDVTSPTGSGKPLTVFIVLQTSVPHNLVATAFYNRQPNVGPLLYDLTNSAPIAESNLRSSYDDGNDILYLSLGDTKSAEDEEIENGVYVGYPEGSDRPYAAMVFGIRKWGAEQRQNVIQRLAHMLRIRQNQIREAFEKAY
jgi:uncharacterized protein YuzE